MGTATSSSLVQSRDQNVATTPLARCNSLTQSAALRAPDGGHLIGVKVP